MNRACIILILLLTFAACNKEKKSLRQLDGEWEITSYQEIIFDGTTKQFNLVGEFCKISSSAKSKEGEMNISWTVENSNNYSSFSFFGTFRQISVDLISLISDTTSLDCKIPRQLKRDMTLEMVVEPDRKSILHLRKK